MQPSMFKTHSSFAFHRLLHHLLVHSTLQLGVLLVDENVSVAGVTSFHINNSLVCVLERTLLNPGLDLLLDG